MTNKQARRPGIRMTPPENKMDFLTEFNALKSKMDEYAKKLYTTPKGSSERDLLLRIYMAARRRYLEFIHNAENSAKLKDAGNPHMLTTQEWKLKGMYKPDIKLAEDTSEYKNALNSMINAAYDWKNPKLRGLFGAAVQKFNIGDIPFDQLTATYNELQAEAFPVTGSFVDLSKLKKAYTASSSSVNWVKLAEASGPRSATNVLLTVKDAKEATGSFVNIAKLNKVSFVVHRNNGWHVLSEKGKNLGGPYKSKAEAEKRLRQVEFFKAHASMKRKEVESMGTRGNTGRGGRGACGGKRRRDGSGGGKGNRGTRRQPK